MSEPLVNVRPLRVGVLVDLERGPEAGGHVKCWERFAEAAATMPERIDLSVHFSGSEAGGEEIAANVRYIVHKPVFSTARLPFLRGNPDHTDLAPGHPALRRELGRYDVIHATDAYFAFARTARAYCRRHGVPLVSSTHTDTPKYTRLFTRDAVVNLVGAGPTSRLLIDRWRLHERAGRSMSKKLDRYLAASDYVLASSQADYARAVELLPGARVSRLRRGVDTDFFHPRRRDRAALAEAYGVPEDRPLLLFVGRIDDSKSPLALARAVEKLVGEGRRLHVLFAGRGNQRDQVAQILGDAATLTGPLDQQALQGVYSGADLFAFPSTTELMPNVVVEAKASGVPVLLSAHGGSAQMVAREGVDGWLMDSENPDDWAAAIAAAIADPARLREMGAAARRHIEESWPTWRDVLEQDLLPVWEKAAGRLSI